MIITISPMFIVFFSMIFIDDCSAIVNGKLASLGELKYMVSLYEYSDRKHVCGGSIMSEFWVITAGHCVYNGDPDDFWIVAGVINLRDRRNRRINLVDYFVLHEEYEPELMAETPLGMHVVAEPINDIALVRVEMPFYWKPFLQPLNNLAPADSELPFGAECQTYGWGAESPSHWDISSDYLNKMKISIINPAMCLHEDYDVTDTTFCGKDLTRTATPCSGDSGGPIICNGIIYGLLSVSQCDIDGASLYTTVSKYRDWIQKTIEICDEAEDQGLYWV